MIASFLMPKWLAGLKTQPISHPSMLIGMYCNQVSRNWLQALYESSNVIGLSLASLKSSLEDLIAYHPLNTIIVKYLRLDYISTCIELTTCNVALGPNYILYLFYTCNQVFRVWLHNFFIDTCRQSDAEQDGPFQVLWENTLNNEFFERFLNTTLRLKFPKSSKKIISKYFLVI